MRWFKHLSQLSQDEGVARFLDEAGKDGLAAYGFLNRVLEIVAARMNTTDLVCSANYSTRQWARITSCHANRATKFLKLCEVIDWVTVEFEESSCRVSIPRMVEWRDEYTRKSGPAPDKVAQNRADKNREDKRESRQGGSLSEGSQEDVGSRTPPQDFVVTPEMKRWAEQKSPALDIDRETEKFKVYEFPQPKTDWIAAWKKWILDARPEQPLRQSAVSPTNTIEALRGMAPILGLEKANNESEAAFLARLEEANQLRIAKMNS